MTARSMRTHKIEQIKNILLTHMCLNQSAQMFFVVYFHNTFSVGFYKHRTFDRFRLYNLYNIP